MSSSMSRLIGYSSISKLPSLNSTSFAVHPTSHLTFLHNKDLASCSNKSLHYDPFFKIARPEFAIYSNASPPPGVPLPPSGSPSGSMRNWVLGIVLTFVLPFFTHKWGPLLLLKNKVDTIVNTAEHIIEAIEDVAGKVDKVIDDITDDLPENSKLRKTLEALDEVAEGLEKSAHMANHLIDKVEEAEDKLESFISSKAKEEKVSKLLVEKVKVPTQEPTTSLKTE